MNKCPVCQSENAECAISCRKCGLQLLEMILCPVCHTENSKDANFCSGCGATIALSNEAVRRIEWEDQPQGYDNPISKEECGGEEISYNINNTYAWAIAIVPIVFVFIAKRITDELSIMGLMIALLTIVFWILDKSELKKAGYKTSGWMFTLLLVTPLYLFIRAKKTGKEYGYAICWCILFVLNALLTLAIDF